MSSISSGKELVNQFCKTQDKGSLDHIAQALTNHNNRVKNFILSQSRVPLFDPQNPNSETVETRKRFFQLLRNFSNDLYQSDTKKADAVANFLLDKCCKKTHSAPSDLPSVDEVTFRKADQAIDFFFKHTEQKLLHSRLSLLEKGKEKQRELDKLANQYLREMHYKGKTTFLNEPGWQDILTIDSNEELVEKIKEFSKTLFPKSKEKEAVIRRYLMTNSFDCHTKKEIKDKIIANPDDYIEGREVLENICSRMRKDGSLFYLDPFKVGYIMQRIVVTPTSLQPLPPVQPIINTPPPAILPQPVINTPPSPSTHQPITSQPKPFTPTSIPSPLSPSAPLSPLAKPLLSTPQSPTNQQIVSQTISKHSIKLNPSNTPPVSKIKHKQPIVSKKQSITISNSSSSSTNITSISTNTSSTSTNTNSSTSQSKQAIQKKNWVWKILHMFSKCFKSIFKFRITIPNIKL